jgi:XXXCH domain-containing protein
MEKAEKKYNGFMTNEQAAEFLRDLATGIENGSLELGGDVFDWTGIKKIKITFKNKESRVMFKTKLKSEPPMNLEMEFEKQESSDSEPVNESAVSYQALKKRMKQAFKFLHEIITSHQFPSEEEIRFFADDCRNMTGFPGYGDEHYSSFLAKVNEMIREYEHKDIVKLRQAFSDLTSLMKNCHDRYK